MLRIKDEPLYRYDVTLLAVSIEGQADEWVFLPFDTEQAEFYPVVPDRLLAIGESGAMRLFDVPTRTCLLDAPAGPSGRYTSRRPWAWSEARQSLITFHNASPHRGAFIRELRSGVPGDQTLKLPRFNSVKAIAPRAEGDVILFGEDLEESYWIGRLDLDTQRIELQETRLIPVWRENQKSCEPRWPSPDGRYIVRLHLDAVLRDDPATRRSFDPLCKEPLHADLVGATGKQYGIALDIYRTWPFQRVRTLVLRYIGEPEFQAARQVNGGRMADWRQIDFAALDALADASDRRRGPASQGQFLATLPAKLGWTFGPAVRREKNYSDADRARMQAEAPAFGLLNMLLKIEWDPDSNGFTAHFADDTSRHCSLDGSVGPFVQKPHFTERMISRKQREPVVRALRERTTRRIKLPDLEMPSLVAGLTRIADEMEKGMAKLVVNGILGWTFQVGGKTLPESAFYARVLAAPAADHPRLLKPLTAIFQAYADQIGTVDIRGEQLYSLEREPGDADIVRAALAEAAVAFATLDPAAHLLLKAWFASVDSEHDPKTVDRVFSAIATRTGFRTIDLIVFGLWFERMMVQTWKDSPAMADLLAAAEALLTPADFAQLAFSGALGDVDARNAPPLDMQVNRILSLLAGNAGSWATEAAGHLEQFHRQHMAQRAHG